MRLFIAGATGDLGRALLAESARRGHVALGLARSPEKAAVIRSLGGDPVSGDLFRPEFLARAVAQADVVIHAATRIPAGTAVRRASAWAENDRLRRDGTRALTELARRVGARSYLQQSVAWVVRTRPDGPAYDEETPADPPVLLRSAVDGERIAREALDGTGVRVGVLRGGAFYGADTGNSRTMAAMLRAGRLPIIGRGDHLTAPIHVDDMARAFVLAAERGAAGTWHIVDDEPVRMADFLTTFARALGARAPRRVPAFVGRLLLGGDVMESLMTSMRTTNARAKRELGWAPVLPSVAEGIPQMVRTWEMRGGAQRSA